VAMTAEIIAGEFDMPVEDFAETACRNTLRAFRIDEE